MKSMESDYNTKNEWAGHSDKGYYFSLSVQRRWYRQWEQAKEWVMVISIDKTASLWEPLTESVVGLVGDTTKK